jgi:hypothetical protein
MPVLHTQLDCQRNSVRRARRCRSLPAGPTGAVFAKPIENTAVYDVPQGPENISRQCRNKASKE